MGSSDRDNLPPGATRLLDMADAVARLLTDRLASAAARANGTLAPRDIQAVIDSVDPRRDPELRDLARKIWHDQKEDFERAFWAGMRTHQLERLIVARFDSMLTPRDSEPVQGRTLSRRVIPAFITALHQMVGPELFEEYEDRARELVEAIKQRHGDAFEWSLVLREPAADILVNDILVYIARYLQDAAKRRTWMIGIFERSMPPGQSEAERNWQFDDQAFHMMLSGLYAPMARALKDATGRTKLEKRYGEGHIRTLENALTGLAQDQQKVLGRNSR